MKLLILILLPILGIATFQTNDKNIIGQWSGENEPEKQSEFYLGKDGFYYGKLIADGNHTENIGKVIMKKISYDATTKTFKGKMTPPNENLELNVTISFVNNDKIKIVAKKLFLSKTIYFLRIKS